MVHGSWLEAHGSWLMALDSWLMVLGSCVFRIVFLMVFRLLCVFVLRETICSCSWLMAITCCDAVGKNNHSSLPCPFSFLLSHGVWRSNPPYSWKPASDASARGVRPSCAVPYRPAAATVSPPSLLPSSDGPAPSIHQFLLFFLLLLFTSVSCTTAFSGLDSVWPPKSRRLPEAIAAISQWSVRCLFSCQTWVRDRPRAAPKRAATIAERRGKARQLTDLPSLSSCSIGQGSRRQS